MKKIILFLLVLVSINGLAQFPATQSQGTINTKVVSNGGFQAMKGLINGVYADTSAANAGYIDFYTGAQIYCTSDQYFYLRDTLPMRWTKMAKFSDITGSSNIEYKQGLYNEGIVVFYDDFKRDYFGSDYTLAFPATTETISSAGLRLVGTPGDYVNYISRDYQTCVGNFKETIRYVNNSVTGSSYGIATGILSSNTECCPHSVIGGVIQVGGNLGKSYITGIDYAATTIGADAISISAGDSIEVVFTRTGWSYTVLTTNLTTDETSTVTQATTSGGSPFAANNTGKPSINFFGGDITVIGYEYRIFDTYNADYMFIGNSIAFGQAATSIDTTFAVTVFNNYTGITKINNSGGGDYTQSVLDKLEEIYKLNPKYAMLMIGGNDILFGISSATWKANYRGIRDSLTAHGINVVHLAPTPRTGTDVRDLRNFIDTSDFDSDIKILKTFDSLKTGTADLISTYDAGDGLHLNNAGNRKVDSLIENTITPVVRELLPTVPLNALRANNWNPAKRQVLYNYGWDTIPRGSSGGGGGYTSPAGSDGDIQYNVSGAFAAVTSNGLNYDNTAGIGLRVKNYVQALGGLITNEAVNSGYTRFIHNDFSANAALPNAYIMVGNPSTSPTQSSLMIEPAYTGGYSPMFMGLSNFYNPLQVGSYQTLFYHNASGNLIVASADNLTSITKKTYYFNPTALNGTAASLTLTSGSKVGIHQVSPDSAFHVVGGLKFVTGRQGAGKVLTSDANGGADWQTPSGGGYTTLSQFVGENNWKTFYSNGSGDVTELSIGAAGSKLTSAGTSSAPVWTTQTWSKGAFMESPSSSDLLDIYQTPVAITVSSLKAILRGSGSPSVTYNVRFGTDITSATTVFTSDITCTSVTTGCSNSSGFNDATIPAGSFIWIYTTAQSGTVNSISFTLNYTED